VRYLTVTTPDNVEVTYRLAGAGSRCAAVAIDLLIQAAVYAAIIFSAYKLGAFAGNLRSFALGLLIIVTLAVYLGYYIISEMTMNGQSPGKKIFKLRVIQDNGRPLTFISSLVRNTVRLVIDQLGVGVVVILFSKKFKRLGDMAAMTVVVAENRRQETPVSLSLPKPAPGNFEAAGQSGYVLSRAEFYALQDFFRREQNFTDGGAFAERALADYFKTKFGADFDRNALLHLMNENKGGLLYE